ncbi:MAG: hypothetical protein QOF48_3064 [Verrucomicrobiota bacterium]
MKPHLLVVHPDTAVRQALGDLLFQAGYELVFAANNTEAVGRFDSSRTRLLILDMDPPFQNMWETFGPLLSVNPGVSILIITNPFANVAASSSLMAEVSALMARPVDHELLLKTIRELLENSSPPQVSGVERGVDPVQFVPDNLLPTNFGPAFSSPLTAAGAVSP